jgi:hypothetical protein
MADSRPEVEITFELNAIATRFQRLPHIFYIARPACVTADIARHRPTTGIQNVDYQPEVELNFEQHHTKGTRAFSAPPASVIAEIERHRQTTVIQNGRQ